MARRSTWILVLIFAILVGLAWIIQHNQGSTAESTATASPTISLTNLYNLGNEQVNQINIMDSSGNEIGLYRDSTSTQWAVAGVPADKADAFRIESISAQLFALKMKETLTHTPPLDAVGLTAPAYTITMTRTDGAQWITYVGSQTPTGNGYYVRVDSGPIFIVDKIVMDNIVGMITNPPLIPTPTPEVTSTGTASPTEIGVQETPTP